MPFLRTSPIRKRIFVAGIAALGLIIPAGEALAHEAPCPPGWALTDYPDPDPYDTNGNGYICTKVLKNLDFNDEAGNSGQRPGTEPHDNTTPPHNHIDDHVHGGPTPS